MLKTFKEIRQFNGMTFLNRHPESSNTKLGYAIQKVASQLQTVLKDYQKVYQDSWYENIGKKQLDCALTDKTTGEVLLSGDKEGREYKYDKAGLAQVLEVERAFSTIQEDLLKEWDAKEFEVSPHYVTDLPNSLTQGDVDIMKGFVIDPSYELPTVAEAVSQETPA